MKQSTRPDLRFAISNAIAEHLEKELPKECKVRKFKSVAPGFIVFGKSDGIRVTVFNDCVACGGRADILLSDPNMLKKVKEDILRELLPLCM